MTPEKPTNKDRMQELIGSRATPEMVHMFNTICNSPKRRELLSEIAAHLFWLAAIPGQMIEQLLAAEEASTDPLCKCGGGDCKRAKLFANSEKLVRACQPLHSLLQEVVAGSDVDFSFLSGATSEEEQQLKVGIAGDGSIKMLGGGDGNPPPVMVQAIMQAFSMMVKKMGEKPSEEEDESIADFLSKISPDDAKDDDAPGSAAT